MTAESWLCCPYDITDPRYQHLALRELERSLSVHPTVDIVSVHDRPIPDKDPLNPYSHVIREIAVVYRTERQIR